MTRRACRCLCLGPAVRLLAAMVSTLLVAAGAQAGGGPENVALVVNADSWASMTVANEFIHLRKIPPGNVIYLSDLPGFEHAGVDEFRIRILEPVLLAIRDRGLADHIDYVIYSSDLPWGIGVGKDVGDRKLPNFITPTASINGLTYLYERVLAKDIEYLGLGSNRYVRRPVRRTPGPPFTSNDHAALNYITGLVQLEKWEEAEEAIRRLVEVHPEVPDLHYNLACCLARQGKADEAVAALGKAVDAGWVNTAHAQADEDLASVRDREDFKRLLQRMSQPIFDVQPARGFRSAYRWAPDGRVTDGADAPRYMLSTMLAVTSGRGNSVTEALAYLRRSAAADGTAPQGTVYFMQNGDIRSKTRQWAFGAATAGLKELGVAAEVLDGVLPKDKSDVAGAMVGAAGFDWKSSGSTILPGAICEHLTSSGGVMSQGAGQTPLSEFLRYGAAGASGTVTEPMAIQAKFPLAFLHVYYARGCSLAEAFYQSVAGPYQLLIVGDPLCRPWARIPVVTVDGPQPGATVRGTIRLRPDVRKPDAVSVDHYELFIYTSLYRQCRPGESFEIDTTSLSDGYCELRVVAVTADPVQTRGHVVMGLNVSNHGHSLEVTPPAEKTVQWGAPIRFRARLTGAREIRFLHNGRPLATVTGEQGEAEIDSRLVGFGPVEIQAVGHVPAGSGAAPAPLAPVPQAEAAGAEERQTAPMGSQVAAKPVAMVVVPPPALKPIEAPPADKATKGLSLTIDGGGPVVVESLRDGNWLTKAGLTKGRSFVLEGYFDVPADDLYQFQVRSSAEPTIEVDSQVLGKPGRMGWRFLPVALKAGTHHLRVSGTFTTSPSLDIRFGGPGAQSLGADRFRCVGPVGGVPAETKP